MTNVLTPTSIDVLQRGLFEKAKQQRDSQFHGLYAEVFRADVLLHAYLLCRARNTHAAGVDGISLADIATYGARKWLKELESDLKEQRYQPKALLRIAYILAEGKTVARDIPTLRDEVCMTAAAIVVEPIVAAWLASLLDPTSPRSRSPLEIDDWRAVLETSSLQMRRRVEPRWLEYLANVSHSDVTAALSSRIADPSVIKLFGRWLTCPIAIDASKEGTLNQEIVATQRWNIPEGLPISRILHCLVLLQFSIVHQNRRRTELGSKASRQLRGLVDWLSTASKREDLRGPGLFSALRNTRLGRALMLSLILHVCVLSLQFGEPGAGLPLFGLLGENRQATISDLNVTLKQVEIAETSPPVMQQPYKEKQEQKSSPPAKSTQPEIRSPGEATVAKIVESTQIVPENLPDNKELSDSIVPATKSRKAKRRESEILTTPAESTWTQPVVKTPIEHDDQDISKTNADRQLEEERIEKERLNALARLEAEREQVAAAAKVREETLARKRREESVREEEEKLKQAAATLALEEDRIRAEAARQRQLAAARAKEEEVARQRADDLARVEAEKVKQQLEAKAAAERAAKKAALEAELAARERAAEIAAQAKQIESERILSQEKARAAQLASAPVATISVQSQTSGNTSQALSGSGRDQSAGSTSVAGRDLAGSALAAARNLPSGLVPRASLEPPSQRRASILGNDPKDIQLAFYGEGWRQKVERIGALNFPSLSRNLVYEPMVVTVSINSDGSLAGLRIVKSSGHIELDNAVRRIIEMSAPFSAFPPDMKRSFDVADITRTWVFVGDRPLINAQ